MLEIKYTGTNKWEVMEFIEKNLTENQILVSMKVSKFTNSFFVEFHGRKEEYIECGNILRKDDEKGFVVEFS